MSPDILTAQTSACGKHANYEQPQGSRLGAITPSRSGRAQSRCRSRRRGPGARTPAPSLSLAAPPSPGPPPGTRPEPQPEHLGIRGAIFSYDWTKRKGSSQSFFEIAPQEFSPKWHSSCRMRTQLESFRHPRTQVPPSHTLPRTCKQTNIHPHWACQLASRQVQA